VGFRELGEDGVIWLTGSETVARAFARERKVWPRLIHDLDWMQREAAHAGLSEPATVGELIRALGSQVTGRRSPA
jgi:hypothetical protein